MTDKPSKSTVLFGALVTRISKLPLPLEMRTSLIDDVHELLKAMLDDEYETAMSVVHGVIEDLAEVAGGKDPNDRRRTH